MIPNPRYPAEAWQVREIGLSLDKLAESESIFALSNGHIGVRGNLDEGDPNGTPGTYLNSFYESRTLPYAEAGYGFAESSQTVLNVTNGKLIRLLVDDEPFDMRYGTIISHERTLDLRAGVLHRVVEWESPARTRIRVRSTRMVSLTRRSLLCVRYVVEALDKAVQVVVQSELVTNEETPSHSDDPRMADVLDHPLAAVSQSCDGNRALLVHQTHASELSLAVAMDHRVDAPNGVTSEVAVREDLARFSASSRLQPGEQLELTKFVTYGWSGARSVPALRDQVEAALVSAMDVGWERLAADQRAQLDRFWDGADVAIEGAPSIQQAARVALFHVFQAAIRAEQRAIPAKGLTGPGYDGHAFWDTEMFVLPMLTATAPHAAADALKWRHATLDLARERARTLHLGGAAFPWRTIHGEECSGYWPASTAAMHINADIAVAAARYVWWTGDPDFERDFALPLLVETARLWSSVGYVGADRRFHINGVTGPDEYSALADDNIYTNCMARTNLECAASAARRWQDQADELHVSSLEIEEWTQYAATMAMPYDEARRVHPQSTGFTDHATWDFEASARENAYPLLLSAHYFDLYRKQVVKQADLVLAMHWADDRFTQEQKARNFAYYEPITVRDSSLSACTQAVLAAEVGQLDLAAEYLNEAALVDLHNLTHSASNGLHLASLAGTWLALVAGFGGMRDMGAQLRFCPQLPPGWTRLCFRVRLGSRRLKVDIAPGEVTYSVDAGEPVRIAHGGESLDVAPNEPVTRSWQPTPPSTPRPTQPPGRAPITADDLSS